MTAETTETIERMARVGAPSVLALFMVLGLVMTHRPLGVAVPAAGVAVAVAVLLA